MNDLLPCPLCGSQAANQGILLARCTNCGCTGLEEYWNQRPVCEWTESGHWYTTGCGAEEHVFDVPLGPFCFNCGGKVEVKG